MQTTRAICADSHVFGARLAFAESFSSYSLSKTIMLRGLYSGATALDALSLQQEAIASNLAHLNTPGHKRMILSFAETMQGSNAENPESSRQHADFSPGRMQSTGRNLDLAISAKSDNSGNAFFSYQGSDGEIYSQNGVLFLNPETNQLVNGDGLAVLGENGPIEVNGNAGDIAVAQDGTLSIDSNPIGKLKIVQFDDLRKLQSESQTYFRAGDANATPAEQAVVQQGVRELSNASPVTEMIALIVGSRQFEAAQRTIRMMSDTMQENTRS